ncbi:MAG: hypothetical protein ACRC1T_09465 [Clostridium chrysemydis]|uniref:hypothetical protein n=1 Tax=Clostridium chrysemydis TaxID=2665504 RepID=UPI003F36D334
MEDLLRNIKEKKSELEKEIKTIFKSMNNNYLSFEDAFLQEVIYEFGFDEGDFYVTKELSSYVKISELRAKYSAIQSIEKDINKKVYESIEKRVGEIIKENQELRSLVGSQREVIKDLCRDKKGEE